MRNIGNMQRTAFDVRGHYFEFMRLKSGAVRLVALDGHWNDKADRARNWCSADAWLTAWSLATSRLAPELRDAAE